MLLRARLAMMSLYSGHWRATKVTFSGSVAAVAGGAIKEISAADTTVAKIGRRMIGTVPRNDHPDTPL
ncbi:hypothetical protein GCM10022248_18580 [Nonomuraea soli]